MKERSTTLVRSRNVATLIAGCCSSRFDLDMVDMLGCRRHHTAVIVGFAIRHRDHASKHTSCTDPPWAYFALEEGRSLCRDLVWSRWWLENSAGHQITKYYQLIKLLASLRQPSNTQFFISGHINRSNCVWTFCAPEASHRHHRPCRLRHCAHASTKAPWKDRE